MDYYLILSIIRIISLLPFRLLYLLSDALFFPLYYIIRYRRKIVRRNLMESFPNKNKKEIITIEKQFYHFLSDILFETCKLGTISQQKVRKRLNFDNLEMLQDLLREGKSVAVFMGHYGNWEWLSTSGLWFNEKSTVVQIYHKLHNKSIDKILKEQRERLNNLCIDINDTVKYIVQSQKEQKHHIYGFIADQSPRKNASKHFIDFLYHEIPVLTGPEKICKHFDMYPVYLSLQRTRRGYYECHILPLHDDPKSLPNYELTKLFFQQLELDILHQPQYYLWTHNRYKFARTKTISHNEHIFSKSTK